jgi:Domain of unknown function (DUF4326)
MPERVQHRPERWLPEGTVYVGRDRHGPGRFGNPFVVGRPHPFQREFGVVADRAQAVNLYADWLPTQPELCDRVVRELPGRTLACWCPLDGGPCHGEILLTLANTRVWALTEQQPWAWAITHAGKRVENRTWAPPAAVIGRTLTIHAGGSWWPGWRQHPLLAAAWDDFTARRDADLGPLRRGAPFCHEGAIVAQAILRSVHVAANGCCRPWGEPGFDHPDRGWVDVHHWVLDDVRPLPTPIPCRGWQLLWQPAPVTRAALIAATRRVP